MDVGFDDRRNCDEFCPGRRFGFRRKACSSDWRSMEKEMARHYGDRVRISSLFKSAVLVPMLTVAGRPSLLLVEKRDDLPKHGGQIAFPGGKMEPYDKGPVETALREFEEETGLPSSEISVVDMLDPELTHTTGFVIVPVVGFLKNIDNLKKVKVDSNEIKRIIIFFLDDPNGSKFELETFALSEGFSLLYPIYRLKSGVRIWGATARILLKIMVNSGVYFKGALERRWL